jgi:hypothetical protein
MITLFLICAAGLGGTAVGSWGRGKWEKWSK